jgi:3,4-dihydroxy 2-butanone 4-phosphate synthase/GTP cyclohydrolase II
MAGFRPVAVICEILKEDGSVARLPDLFKMAEKHDLNIYTIEKIIEERRKKEILVQQISDANLPTRWGNFRVAVYQNTITGESHVALIKGEIRGDDPVLVRVHSECLTGDVFGSFRCDCGDQLHNAMQIIEEEGKGVLLYLRQEGRGIGLDNKIKAYSLQDSGMDTVEANERLGFAADLRDYGIGAQILKDLGVGKIKLMTNNPRKLIGLGAYGLEVVDRVPVIVQPGEHNQFYLETKKKKLGHMLDEE